MSIIIIALVIIIGTGIRLLWANPGRSQEVCEEKSTKSFLKQILGYFLGFTIFIVGIPALMWWVAGAPRLEDLPVGRLYLASLIGFIGLAISIWSLVYMKREGRGNPFDAMGHEVAPRTTKLMTKGPYRLSRNPMLFGTFLYYIGMLVALLSWWPLLVFAVVAAVMVLQVRSE